MNVIDIEKLMGEKIKVWVSMRGKIVLKTVFVEKIYKKYIVVNTGKYKFCILKIDLQHNNKRNAVWVF